jgi:hypothetical protein
MNIILQKMNPSLTNITRRYVINVGITFENVPKITLNLKNTVEFISLFKITNLTFQHCQQF